MRRIYREKTPTWVKMIQREFIWDFKNKSDSVFLTFDDGPIPGATDKALDILKKHNAKATFFCVGSNVKNNPILFERIKDEGHDIGNHTYRHLKGWITNTKKYIEDIDDANNLINSNLFRPPFGKVSPMKTRIIKKIPHYNVKLYEF